MFSVTVFKVATLPFEAIKHDNLKAIMFFLNARGGTWLQKQPPQAQVKAAEEERLEAERKKRAEDEQEEYRRIEEAFRRLTIGARHASVSQPQGPRRSGRV